MSQKETPRRLNAGTTSRVLENSSGGAVICEVSCGRIASEVPAPVRFPNAAAARYDTSQHYALHVKQGSGSGVAAG